MGRRKGPSLTRDDVLTAALAVVADRGDAALGTAAVADQLGIRAPSVYHHFDGNDALRLAVAVKGWELLVAACPPPSADPAASLVAFAHAYRRFALDNPALYRVMTRTPFDPSHPGLLALTARAVGALSGLALDPRQALHAMRGLRAAVHGFVDLEIAGQVRLDVPADESFAWAVALVVGAITSRCAASAPSTPTSSSGSAPPTG